MQKSLVRKGLVLGIIVLFIGVSSIPSVATIVEKHNSKIYNEISEHISILEWNDQYELFEDYIMNKKINPFSIHTVDGSVAEIDNSLILIFINSNLMPYIEDELAVYNSTLVGIGYKTIILEVYGGTVEDLKNQILSYWNDGDNLTGAILIGDHPVAWYHNEFYGNPEDWPCDFFLMDLDGQWLDTDADGLYDNHTDGLGDTAPEIYVGRIDASNIPGDEIDITKNYLHKVYEYWIGNISNTGFALTYTDKDWSNDSSFTRNDIKYAYSNYEAVWYPDVNRDDYVDNRLSDTAYEFIQLACHSNSAGHVFDIGGWAHSDDVRSAHPKALYYNLGACSALRFTNYNCLGNAYILDTASPSLAVVGTTKSGLMLAFRYFYEPLGMGWSLGSAFKNWFEYVAPSDDDPYKETAIELFYGMIILGDPTLIPRRNINVYVDGDFNESTLGWQIDHFDNIEDGVDAVAENGTVYVFNGTYYENVVINKTLNLFGEDEDSTIIDGSEIGDVLYVSADWINISGFTIRNSGSAGYPNIDAGIDIRSNHICILNNTIGPNNQLGINLWYSTNNTISGNAISSNDWDGIYLFSSSCITISHNNISLNNNAGIYLHFSSNNTISSNIISSNSNYGVRLRHLSNCNLVYHNNLFNNTENAYDEGTNTWYNTTLHEGNYWSDFDEPSEGAWDNNSNGIVDDPYDIPGGDNQDLYPLMEPFGIDTEPPIVVIESPENGTIFSEPDITLTGYATDNVGIVESGYSHSWSWGGAGGGGGFSEPLLNWSFEDNFTLFPGYNGIGIYAKDAAGNRGRDNITVLYGGIADLYVDDDFDESMPLWQILYFDKIQDAINAANPTDTIFVFNGTYYEHVTVNKQILLMGENRNYTIIDGSGIGDVVKITVDSVNITGFTVQNSGNNYSDAGINLNSPLNIIHENIIKDVSMGVWSGSYFSNNIITGNIIKNTYQDGVFLNGFYNTISNNLLYNLSRSGITAWYGGNNIILGNIINESYENGILLYRSREDTLEHNEMFNCSGLEIRGESMIEWQHNIDTSNSINDKPIFYFINEIGLDIPSNAGQVILVNCSYCTGTSLSLHNTSVGLEIAYSHNNTFVGNRLCNLSSDAVVLYSSEYNNISGNDIINNNAGFELDYSNNNTFSLNNITDNKYYGFEIEHSSNSNIISWNTIKNNWIHPYESYGIILHYNSNHNSINQNIISKFKYGINQQSGSSNRINGNIIENNSVDGIAMFSGSNNIVSGNTIQNNDRWGIASGSNNIITDNNIKNNGNDGISSGRNNVISSNLIENNGGDGIYSQYDNNSITDNIISNNDHGIYLNRCSNNIISDNTIISNSYHGVYLNGQYVPCNNNYIFNNTISDNNYGITLWIANDNNMSHNTIDFNTWDSIWLYSSNNNTISGNSMSNGWRGILLQYSSDNIILENTLNSYSDEGILLEYTINNSNNIIYHNNLANNGINAVDYGDNIWYNSTLQEGNYWSDYTGEDNNHDGIGDTPYNIPGGSNQDLYPLMQPYGTTPTTHMGMIPSENAVVLGDEFNITIYIDPTEPVGGWHIHQLNFTQGKVDATEVTPGLYWVDLFDDGIIDNDLGMITDIQTWTIGPYPDINHTACIINFTALQPGLCTFEIVSVQISDSGFEDLNVTTHTASIVVTTPPIIYDEYPVDLSIDVERPPAELNATVEDPDGDIIDVYIKWMNHDGEWVTLETYSGVGNGTFSFIPSGNDWIWGGTTYTWSVHVTDGITWTNETYEYTTGGSRYDVSNNDLVNFQDAGLVWVHRTSEVPYDGLYDVNGDGQVNFQDAGLTWINRD